MNRLVHETTLVDGKPIQDTIGSVGHLSSRYLRERGGDFTDTTLSAKLASLSVGSLVLLPGEISGIDISPDDVSTVHLREIPELEKGRTNSVNDVRFGQLHIDMKSSQPVTELVATKYLHRLAAPVEFHAGKALNMRMNDIVTFDPLGFVKHPNETIGYLTRYEHGTVTLDNVLWNPDASDSQRENAMFKAGLWLSHLHNHGMVHGDAQAKNIAFDSSNRPRYVDLEKAKDVSYGMYDSVTNRLNDVRDLFNPTYMPPTTKIEESALAESYMDNQLHGREQIDEEDILDSIASVKEQS